MLYQLSYTRTTGQKPCTRSQTFGSRTAFGGEGWIRTSVGVSQQIYSLPPLATRAPLPAEPVIIGPLPFLVKPIRHYSGWCRMPESNWRPSHYKCAALPTELIRRGGDYTCICLYGKRWQREDFYLTSFSAGFLLPEGGSGWSGGPSGSPSAADEAVSSGSKNMPWPFSRAKIPRTASTGT